MKLEALKIMIKQSIFASKKKVGSSVKGTKQSIPSSFILLLMMNQGQRQEKVRERKMISFSALGVMEPEAECSRLLK